MRDFRDSKLMANALSDSLAERDIKLSRAESLEIVARQFGFDDWNVLSARIKTDGAGEAAGAIRLQQAIPILRIFSVEKAEEFYLKFLGFTKEWEHRFFDNAPVYMQVSRPDLKLHLSEHHGDSSPGSTIFVWMRGVDAYRAELMETGYPYSKPGIETAPWGRILEVPDPFGNRIRFCEPPE